MNPLYPAENYLDLEKTEHQVLFEQKGEVWEVLRMLGAYLQFRIQPGVHAKILGRPFISDSVFIGEGTIVEPGAVILGPAWIGRDCILRSGCYIRQNVIVGNRCVLGNSCEFKNAVLFDDCEVPHFNYVGDSILGWKAHLGAGVILSNVRLDRGEVRVASPSGPVPTGLRKFGAIIGDKAEIGCNAVLSPGSIIGRNSLIYPCVHWHGVLPANQIVRLHQNLDVVPRLEKNAPQS